jgi:phospholipase/carboxylesterase
MDELQGFLYIADRMELDAAPLLLLHGSSGTELDLIPLADEIAPFRPYFSLRGRVEWEDGFAFFKRNADRTLNYDDLAEQTRLLARFIKAALDSGLIKRKPILLGFSNGAIVASSVLFQQPQLVSGAILIRPLSPAPAANFSNLAACPILIAAGENDQRRSPGDARLIAAQLSDAGAAVTTKILPAGHGLHRDEPQIIRAWLDAGFCV